MHKSIPGISEEDSIDIDILLLKGKKIPAIKLYIDLVSGHIGEVNVIIEERQAYLCEINLAKAEDNYCTATESGLAWLAENVKLNPKRHFYLYAKGHYERGDMIADLKKIADAYCGNEVNEDGLLVLVGSEAYKYINDHNFVEMLRDAHPSLFRSSTFPSDYARGRSYTVRMLDQLLKILSRTTVQKEDSSGNYQSIINLGEPDPAILPLKKKDK